MACMKGACKQRSLLGDTRCTHTITTHTHQCVHLCVLNKCVVCVRVRVCVQARLKFGGAKLRDAIQGVKNLKVPP